jgi:hypothetical protein
LARATKARLEAEADIENREALRLVKEWNERLASAKHTALIAEAEVLKEEIEAESLARQTREAFADFQDALKLSSC